METPGGPAKARQNVAASPTLQSQWSVEHYLRLILYRWWLVAGIFAIVTLATVIVSSRLPDIYTSDTLILVDPQKVPDSYVKSTVTGDVRNRLGTLSQQILSATRLQKIIDTLNLYPQEKKTMPREDIITRMRKDIFVQVVSDFGGGQDLQAFRITYSGREPRLVAQVTNELASLFIEENLKAREQQATGTTEFLENQLQETRKTLEAQEAKLKDFKLHHIGEMPDQQTADLQILGQLQSQLQLENDALSRAQQQKSYIQSMMASESAPVVDVDEGQQAGPASPSNVTPQPARSPLAADKAKLATLLTRYGPEHPEVRRLKAQIEQEEAKEALANPQVAQTAPVPAQTVPVPAPPRPPITKRVAIPTNYTNPVLESQLHGLDGEIAKHKQEQQRLSQQVASYQAKLETIPVREQEITGLVRDYEISKAHYSHLLENQLSAETATQLEIRQKGERFSILDPAQPAEKPSRPNRQLIDTAGALGGLGLGIAIALMTEFLGICITSPDQITAATGLQVLEVIPIITTQADRLVRKRRIAWATVSGIVFVALAGCAFLLYRYHTQGL